MHSVWKEFIIKIYKMTNKNRSAGSKMTLQVLFCVVVLIIILASDGNHYCITIKMRRKVLQTRRKNSYFPRRAICCLGNEGTKNVLLG